MGAAFCRFSRSPRAIPPPFNGFVFRSDGILGRDGGVERLEGAETKAGEHWTKFVLARMERGFSSRQEMEEHLRELEAYNYAGMSIGDEVYAKSHVAAFRGAIEDLIEGERFREGHRAK